MAMMAKYCVMCHARQPAHAAVSEPPNGVAFETIDDVKRHAPAVMLQAVINKSMPVGIPETMRDEERERLGQWLRALK
jgi:uncharacterized membrane protein